MALQFSFELSLLPPVPVLRCPQSLSLQFSFELSPPSSNSSALARVRSLQFSFELSVVHTSARFLWAPGGPYLQFSFELSSFSKSSTTIAALIFPYNSLLS